MSKTRDEVTQQSATTRISLNRRADELSEQIERQGEATADLLSVLSRQIEEVRQAAEQPLVVVVETSTTGDDPGGLPDFERRAREFADAIELEVVVYFGYTKENGEKGPRAVSPYELRDTATGLHLIGYDHYRRGIRQFAVARTKNPIGLPGIPFVDRVE